VKYKTRITTHSLIFEKIYGVCMNISVLSLYDLYYEITQFL